ncbi:MAG: PAS domain S-box protein, partial [Aquabacterium sp.]
MPTPAEIERWRLLAHRWQQAFDHSAIGQACTGLDGRFLEVNDRFCRFLGYDRAELLRMTFRDLTHADDLAASTDLTRRLVSGEIGSGRYEKRYRHADGRTIWADVTVTAIRDDQGRPLYYATLVVDISERKQLNATLHDRNALLSSLSRNIPGAVLKFVIGTDGSWTLPYASDGIGELYELDPQLLREQPMLAFDLVHHEDRPAALGLMEDQFVAMHTGGASRIPSVFEYRLVLPRKGLRHMRAMISLEREGDGATALYCYITDISGQKQYEQALVQAQAAQAASRAKTEFLSRMSHELRTPLNAVLGFAQLQRLDGANPLNPVQAGRNAQIEAAGAHLLAMIGDVLDLSRIEAGDLPLSIDDVDLPAVLG